MVSVPSLTAGTSEHAKQKYLPGRQRKPGIALCLSGGGFRAALFHLGATRRLNELGILSQVDAISAVSGGSIFAAHLAERLDPWPQPRAAISSDEWDTRVAEPFRAYVRKDLRTPAILKGALDPRRVAADYLADDYEKHLTAKKLSELPARPVFTFCATDLSYGANWIFTRERIGDYKAGYMAPTDKWTVARAVAASSCFPPVFAPMELRLKAGDLEGGKAAGEPNHADCVEGLRLSDGGLYDNMGLEPVWKEWSTVLVSDGGATFDHKADKGPLDTLLRYTDIQGAQAIALRKRWLIANFAHGIYQGAYWGSGSAASNYQPGAAGYSKPLVDDVISEVRTDMDAFSEAEAQVLENHGYLMAEVAVRQHLSQLDATGAPPAVPHKDAMDETWVRQALAESHKRKYVKMPWD